MLHMSVLGEFSSLTPEGGEGDEGSIEESKAISNGSSPCYELKDGEIAGIEDPTLLLRSMFSSPPPPASLSGKVRSILQGAISGELLQHFSGELVPQSDYPGGKGLPFSPSRAKPLQLDYSSRKRLPFSPSRAKPKPMTEPISEPSTQGGSRLVPFLSFLAKPNLTADSEGGSGLENSHSKLHINNSPSVNLSSQSQLHQSTPHAFFESATGPSNPKPRLSCDSEGGDGLNAHRKLHLNKSPSVSLASQSQLPQSIPYAFFESVTDPSNRKPRLSSDSEGGDGLNSSSKLHINKSPSVNHSSQSQLLQSIPHAFLESTIDSSSPVPRLSADTEGGGGGLNGHSKLHINNSPSVNLVSSSQSTADSSNMKSTGCSLWALFKAKPTAHSPSSQRKKKSKEESTTTTTKASVHGFHPSDCPPKLALKPPSHELGLAQGRRGISMKKSESTKKASFNVDLPIAKTCSKEEEEEPLPFLLANTPMRPMWDFSMPEGGEHGDGDGDKDEVLSPIRRVDLFMGLVSQDPKVCRPKFDRKKKP